MPKHPPTLVERLRTAWARRSSNPAPSTDATAARSGDPAGAFADRLRAAVTTRD